MEFECPVCLNPFLTKENFFNFKCNITHSVCYNCVSSIYKTFEDEFKCPLCRVNCKLEDEDFISINKHLKDNEKIVKRNDNGGFRFIPHRNRPIILYEYSDRRPFAYYR